MGGDAPRELCSLVSLAGATSGICPRRGISFIMRTPGKIRRGRFWAKKGGSGFAGCPPRTPNPALMCASRRGRWRVMASCAPRRISAGKGGRASLVPNRARPTRTTWRAAGGQNQIVPNLARTSHMGPYITQAALCRKCPTNAVHLAVLEPLRELGTGLVV